MNLAILATLFLWLQYEVTMANLGKELEESLERAMKCEHRDPPAEPVLALTPYRFSQLLAVMRHNSRAASCGRPQIDSPFNPEDIRTWPFCLFGTCEWDKCVCLPAYSGPNCATFTKRCWLMYCFLTSCHPIAQSIFCKCDPRLYGRKVLSGEYWYNGVKRNVYIPPPPDWRDDESVAGINTAILNVPDVNDPAMANLGDPPVNRHRQGQEHPRNRPQTGDEYGQVSPGGEHLRSRPQTVGIPVGQPAQADNQNVMTQERQQSNQNAGTSGKELQKPHSVSASDVKEVQEETSEDLKEALAEIEEKPSASVTLTPGWAVFLIVTFNIYMEF